MKESTFEKSLLINKKGYGRKMKPEIKKKAQGRNKWKKPRNSLTRKKEKEI